MIQRRSVKNDVVEDLLPKAKVWCLDDDNAGRRIPDKATSAFYSLCRRASNSEQREAEAVAEKQSADLNFGDYSHEAQENVRKNITILTS